jgi:hypothetical protein
VVLFLYKGEDIMATKKVIPYLHPDNWIWYRELKALGLEELAKQIACLEKHKRIAE